ncbi:hypothetical protein CsSME_00007255 [Camellia sinensis var. sinensis]
MALRIIAEATSAIPIAISVLVNCRSFMDDIRVIGDIATTDSEAEDGDDAVVAVEGSSWLFFHTSAD